MGVLSRRPAGHPRAPPAPCEQGVDKYVGDSRKLRRALHEQKELLTMPGTHRSTAGAAARPAAAEVEISGMRMQAQQAAQEVAAMKEQAELLAAETARWEAQAAELRATLRCGAARPPPAPCSGHRDVCCQHTLACDPLTSTSCLPPSCRSLAACSSRRGGGSAAPRDGQVEGGEGNDGAHAASASEALSQLEGAEAVAEQRHRLALAEQHKEQAALEAQLESTTRQIGVLMADMPHYAELDVSGRGAR